MTDATTGEPIHINLLWGIAFGGGAVGVNGANHLFFTAGPDNYATGLFGEIIFQQ